MDPYAGSKNLAAYRADSVLGRLVVYLFRALRLTCPDLANMSRSGMRALTSDVAASESDTLLADHSCKWTE